MEDLDTRAGQGPGEGEGGPALAHHAFPQLTHLVMHAGGSAEGSRRKPALPSRHRAA